jgi:hypothetical protein
MKSFDGRQVTNDPIKGKGEFETKEKSKFFVFFRSKSRQKETAKTPEHELHHYPSIASCMQRTGKFEN